MSHVKRICANQQAEGKGYGNPSFEKAVSPFGEGRRDVKRQPRGHLSERLKRELRGNDQRSGVGGRACQLFFGVPGASRRACGASGWRRYRAKESRHSSGLRATHPGQPMQILARIEPHSASVPFCKKRGHTHAPYAQVSTAHCLMVVKGVTRGEVGARIGIVRHQPELEIQGP